MRNRRTRIWTKTSGKRVMCIIWCREWFFIKGDTLTVVFTGGVNVEMLSSDHHDMRPHESHCRVRRCEIFKKKWHGEDGKRVLGYKVWKKKLSLTFDDGPHPVYTEAVLDVLKQYNVKATFFCVGSRIDKYPITAKRIVEEGHEIGNHTMNHVYFHRLKRKDILQELHSSAHHITSAMTGRGQVIPPAGRVAESYGFQKHLKRGLSYHHVVMEPRSEGLEKARERKNRQARCFTCQRWRYRSSAWRRRKPAPDGWGFERNHSQAEKAGLHVC